MRRSVATVLLGGALLLAKPARAIRDMQGPNEGFIKTNRCQPEPPDGWGYGAEGWLQACVALGTADYCGTGESHTAWGTPILIYDIDHPDSRAPASGGHEHWLEFDLSSPAMRFEAAFRPFHQTGKDRGSALCLSKLRWATLPLGGHCPDLLPDPRISQKGHFCEDLTGRETSLDALEANDPAALSALRDRDAFIFVKSSFLDLGLHLWRDPAGLITTAQGFDAGPAGGVSLPPAFAPGASPVRTPDGSSLVGLVLSDEARWFMERLETVHRPDEPTSVLNRLAAFSYRPLVTYLLADGKWLTTTQPGLARGATREQLEGWVFKFEAEARLAKRLLAPRGLASGVGKLERYGLCPARDPGCTPTLFATSVAPPPAVDGRVWRALGGEGFVLLP